MENKGTFLRSSFNLNGIFVQMLHFQPCFTKKLVSLRYEISGTDGLILEVENKIIESNLKKNIITFECKMGETYFCKVTGYFNESKSSTQTIRLFYKVENDDDDIIGKSDSQKIGFKKLLKSDEKKEEVDEEDNEDDEDDEQDEDDEDDEDDPEDVEDVDDENITLEMRVEQLKKFSNYFSDEE